MATLRDQLRHAWNAFTNQGDNRFQTVSYGPSYSSAGGRPDRQRLNGGNERSLVSSIYTRIAIDVASVDIKHVKLDSNNRYSETVNDGLNNCLTLEANIDQGSRAFKKDIAMMLFNKGAIAIVPVDTTLDPKISGSYDIRTMRVAEILEWYPEHVRVDLYNQKYGRREEIVLPKSMVAIVENPLYEVMNEPNSTLQRLIKKLNMLDLVDEQSSSGKLDIIIQLPYVIKSDVKREQATARRKDLEDQLKDSKYGVGYVDATEKITQLNRPAENNMLEQIEMLTEQVYSQLGMSKAIFDGTASESVMLNYENRTIEPILAAITQAMNRTFLTQTARTQKHSIEFYRDPFKFVSIKDFAELADKLSRNEIMSGNELRAGIGLPPSSDPKAEELRNSNMPLPEATTTTPTLEKEGELQNGT